MERPDRAATVDMSPDAVDARVRALASLSRDAPPATYTTVDMSPEAVTARLRDWAEISALALELAAAGGHHGQPGAEPAPLPASSPDPSRPR